MDEAYKKKLSKGTLTGAVLATVFSAAAAVYGWAGCRSAMMLIVFSIVGAVALGYLKEILPLLELLCFGLGCAVGIFIPGPFYITGLLGLDVGLFVLALAAVLLPSDRDSEDEV